MSSSIVKQLAIATVGKDTGIEIRRRAQAWSQPMDRLRYRLNKAIAAPLHKARTSLQRAAVVRELFIRRV